MERLSISAKPILFLVLAIWIPTIANAQVLDAIRGHAQDLKARFSDHKQIEVARLTKPNGAAYYPLKTQNIDDVRSVLIWCKQFKEYIGSVDLVAEK